MSDQPTDQPTDQPSEPILEPVEVPTVSDVTVEPPTGPVGAQSEQCLRHYTRPEQPVSARDRIGVCTLLAGHDGPHGEAA